ncbi:MAG TPA: Gfo/Idh/MocA family oxidoreductase [Opitutaceae bacterium]|nr:Gfo/Idh/MocA family oxidoreductase [Opitutaceae bacterium]
MKTPFQGTRPRVGIVGISGYGKIHLQLIQEQEAKGALEFAAAVVINPRDEAAVVGTLRERGTTIYATFDEMLAAEAGRLDLCLIPTGIAWHARMTIAGLEAGMNVLVEKPLAGSLAEVDAIIDASTRSGRFVAVGFQDIYNPIVRTVKLRLLAGDLGRLRSIKFLGFWPRSSAYFTRNNWVGRLRADGVAVLDSPLNNAFAHFVNLSLYFAGTSPEGFAQAHDVRGVFWRTNAIESFDTAVVQAVTENDVHLWLGASHASALEREPEIVVQGEYGQLTWRHEKECLIETSALHERLLLPQAEETRRMMMQAVLDRLTGRPATLCTPEMARHHTALVTAIHESAVITAAPGRVERIALADGNHFILQVNGIEQRLQSAFVTGELPSQN